VTVPVPLVPLALAAGAALITGAAGVALRKRLGFTVKSNVAILGADEVGKTTLLHFLRYGRILAEVPPTVQQSPGSTFTVAVDGEAKDFVVSHDLPGNDEPAFRSWKAAVRAADVVFYVFRADLVAQEDKQAETTVERHLELIVGWLAASKRPDRRVILIGTHIDLLPESARASRQLKAAVLRSRPIKSHMVKLDDARLVLGSLSTTEAASSLKAAIAGHLD